jgi:glycosyltransferase involved in cell wall biosynthesis
LRRSLKVDDNWHSRIGNLNILYINHYAGSPAHGMEFRPYYLAKEWVDAGHEVRILASSFSHLRVNQPQMHGKKRQDERIDGIGYTWFSGVDYSGNGVGRIRNMLGFMRALYAHGAEIAEQFKPDIVIASSTYPMDIWPARRIAKRANAKLVFEVHDLWPLSPMELGGMSRWHPFIMWVQAAEDYAYRHADSVVSILPNVRDYMASRGMDLSKLIHVPNGVAPADWAVPSPELPKEISLKIAEIRAGGRHVIGYVGGHGISNALDQMLDLAEAMRQDPVDFVLVGNGPEKKRLLSKARAAGLDHVHFFDPVIKACVPALLQEMDISYIAWQSRPLYRFGVSANKLFDYMMAGSVVVQSIDPVPNPIEQSGCGVCVPIGDVQGAADAIRELLSMPPQERKEMGERGRRYVLEKHFYPVLAKRFIESVSG